MKTAFLALGLLVAPLAHGILIDDFSTGFDSVTTKTSKIVFESGAMLGGERYNFLGFVANPNNRSIGLDIDGIYSISTGVGVESYIELGYGFKDNGSGGWTPFDLNQDYSAIPALRLNFLSNDRDLTAWAYVGSNLWTDVSRTSVLVAGNQDSPFSVDLNLGSLTTWIGSGVNLADVDQITFVFQTKPAGDFALTSVETVPEPASMAALGLGIAALVARRRRK
jgi:hypothetical protein